MSTNISQLGDEALIELVLGGDGGAFDELVHRHRKSCIGIALSIVRNPEDAEDAVQNSLCKAYFRLAQFEQRAKFTHWLFRIVSNECFMQLRRRRRQGWMYSKDRNSQSAATEWTPERMLLESEMECVIRHAVRGLPVMLRGPVQLHEMESLPLQEVARRLNTTVAATKSRLHRGRRELKARLAA